MGLLYDTNAKILDIARRAIEVQTGEDENARIELVDCVTGELLTKELEDAEITKTDVLLNLAKEIKNLNAQEMAIKSEMESLKKRAESAKSKAETLKRIIARFGYQTNVSDAQVGIKWRKGAERVELLDEMKIPKQYGKEYWKPDKAQILKALKGGETVEGCALVRADDTFSIV